MQETQVRSQGLEDSLEKGMTIHSSVLAWRISWPELADYSPWGHKGSDRTQQLTHTEESYTQRNTKTFKEAHWKNEIELDSVGVLPDASPPQQQGSRIIIIIIDTDKRATTHSVSLRRGTQENPKGGGKSKGTRGLGQVWHCSSSRQQTQHNS